MINNSNLAKIFGAFGKKAADRLFLLWRYVDRKGKRMKVPFRVTNTGNLAFASSTDPKHRLSLKEAKKHIDAETGIGVTFSEVNNLVGIDLDNCIDTKTGEISGFAEKVMKLIPSYTELSPSGKGLHILVEVQQKPSKALKRPEIEVYPSGRYFTLTGDHFGSTPETIITLPNLNDLYVLFSKKESILPNCLEIKGQERDSIQWGEIDDKLFSRACKARDDGFGEDEILALLNVWRATDVVESDKVPDSHLRDIARSAMRYTPTEPSAPENAFAWESTPDISTPVELIESAPGWIRTLMVDILDTSIVPNPGATIAATLPALGTLFGQKVESDTGLRTNVYSLIISPPGNGKDYPKKAIKKIFQKAGCPMKYAVDDVTSDTAINQLLVDHPSCTLLLDEFGVLLQTASRSKGPASTVLRTLLSVYNQASEVYYAKRLASGEGLIIENPNLSIWAAGTPDQIQRAMSAEVAATGLLSRVIFFQESEMQTPRRSPARMDVSSYAERFAHYLGGGAESILTSSPTAKRLSIECDDLHAFDTTLRARINDASEGLKHLLVRIHEHARKVALLGYAATNLRTESIQWGIKIAEHQIEQAVYWYERSLGGNERASELKRIYSLIERADSGLKHAELVQATPELRRNERADIIADLEDSGMIVKQRMRRGGFHYSITKNI